jgi:hypothetical protein
MAMSGDDVLKMTAVLEDKFSKPMQDMVRQVRVMGDAVNNVNKTINKGMQAQTASFKDVGKEIKEVTGHVTGLLSPAMAALGITGLSVASALAAVVVSTQKWVNLGSQLHQLHTATGLTIQHMRELMELGEHVGLSNDQMAASFTSLSDTMLETKQNMGSFYSFLQVQHDQYYHRYLASLQAAKTEDEQYELTMAAARHAERGSGGAAAGRLLLSKAGLSPALLSATPEEEAKYRTSSRARLPTTQKDVDAAQDAADAITDMELDAQNLMEVIGKGLTGATIDATTALREFAATLRGADWHKAVTGQETGAPPALPEENFNRLFGDESIQHATGGHVLRSHFAMVHAGEDIIPASDSKSPSDAVNLIAEGTRKGVYDGLWDFYNSRDTAGGGAPGAQKVSYTPDAPGGNPLLNKSPMGDLGGPGTRGNRNNNRGNMKYGRFAQEHGATGADSGGFAIFPDTATGDAAQAALLQRADYHNLTPHQFAAHYAEGSPGLEAALAKRYGSTGIVDTKDPGLQQLIRKTEGTDVDGSGGTGIPSHILAEAEKYADMGPGAVQMFLQSQGLNKGESWCGEFAAKVVTAAGGHPPRNPAIASNWRNWGVYDDLPHAGDMAVKNTGRTGSPGSHVAVVGSVDKDGRVHTIGGNQGRMRGTLDPRNYEFRRPTEVEETAQAARQQQHVFNQPITVMPGAQVKTAGNTPPWLNQPTTHYPQSQVQP